MWGVLRQSLESWWRMRTFRLVYADHFFSQATSAASAFVGVRLTAAYRLAQSTAAYTEKPLFRVAHSTSKGCGERDSRAESRTGAGREKSCLERECNRCRGVAFEESIYV